MSALRESADITQETGRRNPQMNGHRHVSLTTALFLTTIVAISALLAAAKEPVPSLEGYWKGSGIVSHKGANDRSFSYTATCAMESGKYDLTGSVTNTSGSRYSGTVVGGSEGSRETGRVFLIQRGKLLSVNVTSRSGSARMTLFKLG